MVNSGNCVCICFKIVSSLLPKVELKLFCKMQWPINFANKIWPPLATYYAKTTLKYYIHYPLHAHTVILYKKQVNYSILLYTCLLYQLNLAFLSLEWSIVSVQYLIQPFWPSSWLAVFMPWFSAMQALRSYHSFARITSKLICTTYQSSHHHLSRFSS